MKNYIKSLLVIVLAASFVWLLWYLAKDQTIAILQPGGAIALQERNLIIIATVLMLAVAIPVFLLTAIITWRYRATNTSARYLPNWEHNIVEEFVWWAIPCIIILILAIITWKSSHELDPFKPLPGKHIVIQVVSLNWKWLFIYPEEKIATVNVIQFPVDVPVEFQITSDAPMNSFWIPQLSGQIYAMTGMVTKLHMVANQSGMYSGFSANISGKGFSGMTFSAKAVSKDEFIQWIAETKGMPSVLDADEYRKIAAPSTYEPPRYYGDVQNGLFDQIVSKYGDSMPMHINHDI
jgi:cytochrome o ubiquinol oxidase subunit 2